MSNGIGLTKAEQIAKEFVMCHFMEGSREPCNLSSTGYELPSWYDRDKFRRGQKYFHNNQHGMMFSSFSAVFSLMCIPKGLKTLIATGLTNSAEDACKRYLATLAFTLIWYKSDLEPDSESLELLKKVRKMHYHASRSAKDKGFGHINQIEISTTAFGFMGFPLVRSHVLEINDKCREDQEGFIHFWAVISYMLGVEDRFNMCLLPLDALCEVCKIIIRYFLLPVIQIETTEFKQMASVLINGLKGLKIIGLLLNLESQLFQAKRLLQVPGYQYKVDKSQEIICRSIFSQDEMNELKKSFQDVGYYGCMLLSADIPIIEVEKDPINYDIKKYRSVKNIGTDIVINDRFKVISTEYMHNLREEMNLSSSEFITIRFIQAETEGFSCLNDSKFNELSWFAKILTYLNHTSLWIYNFKIGRFLINFLLNIFFNWVISSSIVSKRKRKSVKKS